MIYKTFRTIIDKEKQQMEVLYWKADYTILGQEMPTEPPDHRLLIRMDQVLHNYAAGLVGICPECMARGIYSPMQRNVIYGQDPITPIAVIDTCIKCGIKNNQLFYYVEDQATQ